VEDQHHKRALVAAFDLAAAWPTSWSMEATPSK
jgi:hypothetical protein